MCKFIANHIILVSLVLLGLVGCGRDNFRHGYSPGQIEAIERASVYHLSDGVFIEERKDDRLCYYLIESTVADYELTKEGLDVKMNGRNTGKYSTTPAPVGYVAAWLTQVQGEAPGVTRFLLDDASIADLKPKLTNSTTVQDIYELRR